MVVPYFLFVQINVLKTNIKISKHNILVSGNGIGNINLMFSYKHRWAVWK